MAQGKRGRPTENPKLYRVTARLDEKSQKVLDAYCRQEHISKMEGVRRGVKKLELDLTTEPSGAAGSQDFQES